MLQSKYYIDELAQPVKPKEEKEPVDKNIGIFKKDTNPLNLLRGRLAGLKNYINKPFTISNNKLTISCRFNLLS